MRIKNSMTERYSLQEALLHLSYSKELLSNTNLEQLASDSVVLAHKDRMQAGQTQILTLAAVSRAKAVVGLGATAHGALSLRHVGARGLNASRRLEQIRFCAVPQRTAIRA